MLIDVKKNVHIENTILKAKKIKIIVQQIKCGLCFADTDELEIEVRSAESPYATIRLFRNKNNQNPMVLQGKLDFVNNSTEGLFIVLGAEKIVISFSPEVFQ